MNLLMRILTYIITLFMITLVALFAYLGFSRHIEETSYPTVFGYGFAIVISGSMEPTLSVNDLVVTKHATSYQVDDVVLFHSATSLVTHRITQISDRDGRYLTQGDANNTDDGWLEHSRTEGKVILALPAVGVIQEFFATKLGTLGLFLLIFFMIFFALESDNTHSRKGGSYEQLSEKE